MLDHLPHATDCVQSRMLQNARSRWVKLHVKPTECLRGLLVFRLDMWTNARGICIKRISALTKQCIENNWVKGSCPVAKVRSIPSTYHDFATPSKRRHCDEANIMCRCSLYSKPWGSRQVLYSWAYERSHSWRVMLPKQPPFDVSYVQLKMVAGLQMHLGRST